MKERYLVALGAVLLGGAGAFAVYKRTKRGSSVSNTSNPKILAAALALLPSPSDHLEPPDAGLDPVYGGRRGEMFGAPSWRYYQTRLDASGRSGGSTCGIVVGYLAGLAGWPRELLNRAADDAWAPGERFTPGHPIIALVGGAKAAGLYIPAPVELRPGDVYHVDHPPKPNSDHVGIVMSVDGQTVGTLDGGQGSGATIKRNVRQLSPDGRTIALDGLPAHLLGVIRAEGQ